MRIRATIIGIMLVLFIIAYNLYPDIFEKPFRILCSGDVEQIAAYIRSFGGWAVLASIALSTIMTFGLIIPFILLSAVNGIVFGLGWGTVVSWVGEVIGAMIAFAVDRYYFRPSIIRRFAHKEHWHYVEKISGEHGFTTILIARILPIIPSGVLTAAASISTVSFRDFAWATIVGKIPSVFLKVLVGHDLVYFEIYQTRFFIGLLVLLTFSAGAWWLKRRQSQKSIFPIFKMRLNMKKLMGFLYQTYICQEKNRRDVLDYLRAIGIIIIFILMAWAAMYYGMYVKRW